MLALDRRIGPSVESFAALEYFTRAGGLPDLAEVAGKVEEHLRLDPEAALPLGGVRTRPSVVRGFQVRRRLARTMQSLEAIAAAEQRQVIVGKRGQRVVVPGDRTRPALGTLEEPARLRMVQGGAARVEFRAARVEALDLGGISGDRVSAGHPDQEVEILPLGAADLVKVAPADENRVEVALSSGFRQVNPPRTRRPEMRRPPCASFWRASG